MKNFLLNLTALGALAAGTMLAQGPPTHGGTPPDPATIVANQVDRLTQLLTLTAAQQAQATTIFTNALASETPLRTNLQIARTSLKTAVQAGDNASIDNLASQIGSITGQELAAQSKAQSAFYKILTPTQQAIYNAMPGRGGFGGPGGAGPDGFGHGPRGQRSGAPRQ